MGKGGCCNAEADRRSTSFREEIHHIFNVFSEWFDPGSAQETDHLAKNQLTVFRNSQCLSGFY